jgi:hypothetical protein
VPISLVASILSTGGGVSALRLDPGRVWPVRGKAIMTTDRENEFDRHLRLRWMCGDADPYMRPDASRLMRPDAERFMRPDWERFVRPEFLEHMRVEARARAKAQTATAATGTLR